MTKIASRIVIVLALLTMSAVIAMADRRSDSVTFEKDTIVNGTLVKSGTYRVLFDYKTNELSVIKDSKPVATAPAHIEKAAHRAPRTMLLTSDKDNTTVMTAITFQGDDRRIILGANSTQPGTGTRN